MNVFALLSFISFVLFFQAGVFVIYKNPRQKAYRVFALLCLLFAIYAFSYYLFFNATSLQEVYLYDRIAAVGWVFFPLVMVWFVLVLTQDKNPVVRYVFLFFLLPVAFH